MVEVVVGATGGFVVGVVPEPPPVDRTIVVVTAADPVFEGKDVVVVLVDGAVVLVVGEDFALFLEADGVDVPHAAATSATPAINKPTCAGRTTAPPSLEMVTAVS